MKTNYGFKCEYCRQEFTWLSCDFNKRLEYYWHVLTRNKKKCEEKGKPIIEIQQHIEESKEGLIKWAEDNYDLKISDKDAEDIMKPFGGHILAMMLLHAKKKTRETQA